MLLLLRSSGNDDSAFSKKDAVIVAIVSGIACGIGIIVTTLFYILVKEPGQCFLNKNKRRLALANNILNNISPIADQTNQVNAEKTLKRLESNKQISLPDTEKGIKRMDSNKQISLPETLNNHVVGATENADYTTGSYKQTPTNDLTPYNYPNFYCYSTAVKQYQQQNSQTQETIPEEDTTPEDTIQELPVIRADRPKLMHSVSMTSTTSDIVGENTGKNLYKKKVGELEKRKSKLSLRSVVVPVRRMFSVDARKQFNCKGNY